MHSDFNLTEIVLKHNVTTWSFRDHVVTSSSQDLMRDLHWTLEMDSNQSGAVGGTIWGPKSLKNELNVHFFEKLSIIRVWHKKWILAWQGNCTCFNSILFVPNIVSRFDIHVFEQRAMKGQGFQWLLSKNVIKCDIIRVWHLSLTKQKKELPAKSAEGYRCN